uniref:MAPEG family protein n=1 Tax=Compsopogon caeruleus TaxID=31354 RepID=A0A7S1XCA9_9RHOD|mmetsp:Transcript_13290/g.27004  ORF Transcript_13290/g.27004 Transcript_13290/m.27004 type:complete len:139 (+) Transcript_13290:176-592(+)
MYLWAVQSVPIAIAIAYAPAFLRIGIQAANKVLDTREPRKAEIPEGIASRADACHKNHLELLPLYAGGILACVQAGVDEQLVSRLATTYIAGRSIHAALYIQIEEFLGTGGTARTVTFLLGCMIPTLRLWLAAAAASR